MAWIVTVEIPSQLPLGAVGKNYNFCIGSCICENEIGNASMVNELGWQLHLSSFDQPEKGLVHSSALLSSKLMSQLNMVGYMTPISPFSHRLKQSPLLSYCQSSYPSSLWSSFFSSCLDPYFSLVLPVLVLYTSQTI